ncbi:MAG TPA: glutathione S-transferase family protein [Rhizomicrobium sp.]|jgi:glutathione S-transferase
MTLKLHVFPPSPRAFKVLFAARQLGIDHELCFVDLGNRDQHAPGFAALNPNRRMPVLEEDGFYLWESNAIVEYLASKKEQWLPRDTRARLAITKWLYWESNHWDPACAIFVFERLVKSLFGLGETSASEIARGEAAFARLGPVLNGELEQHRYVTGDALTIADLALASPFCVAAQAGYPLDEYRAIQRWRADLESLPAWKETVALQQGR